MTVAYCRGRLALLRRFFFYLNDCSQTLPTALTVTVVTVVTTAPKMLDVFFKFDLPLALKPLVEVNQAIINY